MNKKLLIIFVLLVGIFASCTDNFEEMNTDPKNPTDVPAGYLLSNAEIELADQISNANVNLNIWKLMAQYWTETTYTDEANWDIVNRTIPDNIFRAYYRWLKDLDDAKSKVLDEDANIDQERIVKQNKIYVIDLLEVYSYQRLVDIFGNIPYAEALNHNNYTPFYSDADSIYQDLISRTKDAYNGLDDGNGDELGSFDDADFIYGGDPLLWKQFAASLLVKLGITIYDVNESLAKDAIETGAEDVFTSMDNSAFFPYLTSAPYNNSLYDDLVLSGREDFVGANTLIDKLIELDDPRLSLFFRTVPDDTVYLGGVYGETSAYSAHSQPCDRVHQPDFPGILLSYDEVMFYLAEAEERGADLPLVAEEYYNNGVTANIIWWGGTSDDASAYLSEHGYSSYDNWKEAIGTQGWIAMYTRGLVGYTFYRRLDYPEFNMPPNPPQGVDEVPTRFTYPINEQTLNAANYAQASSAIGGDYLTTKLFWDKN